MDPVLGYGGTAESPAASTFETKSTRAGLVKVRKPLPASVPGLQPFSSDSLKGVCFRGAFREQDSASNIACLRTESLGTRTSWRKNAANAAQPARSAGLRRRKRCQMHALAAPRRANRPWPWEPWEVEVRARWRERSMQLESASDASIRAESRETETSISSHRGRPCRTPREVRAWHRRHKSCPKMAAPCRDPLPRVFYALGAGHVGGPEGPPRAPQEKGARRS